MSFPAQLSVRSEIKNFILAGNAIFTLVSKQTQKRFTFKVSLTHNPDLPPKWSVKVLAGRDNSSDYRFIGAIKADKLNRANIRPHQQQPDSFKAFDWFWRQLTKSSANNRPDAWAWVMDQCEFYHAGRCGRCGRLLTVPESVKTGIGPECANRQQMAVLLEQLM
jgi:hypothetical protein